MTRGVPGRPNATCHPDRIHRARGLCNACYKKDWIARGGNNGAQTPDEAKLDSHVRTKYGISAEEYNSLLLAQGGGCAICQRPPDNERLCVDHDHETGRVRGLLCRRCNSGIGQLKDSVALLLRAANYVERGLPRQEEHPPAANGVVAVDFDATIKPWRGGLLGFEEPLPGAPEAVRLLKDAGYTVFVFTSRLSPVWHQHEGWETSQATREQVEFIREYCERFDIPADYVTADKIPAIAYFDDKAVRVSEYMPLLDGVKEFLSGK